MVSIWLGLTLAKEKMTKMEECKLSDLFCPTDDGETMALRRTIYRIEFGYSDTSGAKYGPFKVDVNIKFNKLFNTP